MKLTDEQRALLHLIEQRTRAAFNAAGDARRFSAQLADTFTDTTEEVDTDASHREAQDRHPAHA